MTTTDNRIQDPPHGRTKIIEQQTQHQQNQSQETRNIGDTSIFTAFLRNIETNRPDHVIEDPFAAPLVEQVDSKSKQKISNWVHTHTNAANFIAMRTRYLDEALLHRDESIQQVVILASGLDTRVYRLECLKDCHVFEIDRDVAAHDRKLQIIETHLQAKTLPKKVDYIAADLSKRDWYVNLFERGFDPSKKTFWCMEGLLFYMERKEILRLLGTIDILSAPGSIFWADMCGPQAMEKESSDIASLLKYTEQDPLQGVFRSIGWQLHLQAQFGKTAIHFGRVVEPETTSSAQHEAIQWALVMGRK